MDKNKRIEELVNELNRYSYEYYTLDAPSVSDKDYDKKYDELRMLEEETGYILPYSPTLRVGDTVLEGFSKYTHKGRLWSMDKAQSVEELKEWHNRNKKFIEAMRAQGEDLPDLKYVLTKKFDGLTINLTYDENGVLVTAATRGTGEIGEEVTAQVKTIKSIPLKIDSKDVFEVHGEAIMTTEAFEEYNKKAEVPLKNLRNGAAGALRNLNVKETANRNLSAFFYDVGYKEGKGFKTYLDMMEFIKEKGLPVDDYLEVCTSMEEIEKQIEYFRYFHVVREESQYIWETLFYYVRQCVKRINYILLGSEDYEVGIANLFHKELLEVMNRGSLNESDKRKINRRNEKFPLAIKVWDASKLLIFETNGDVLKGVSGSAGIAAGKVCIINSPKEFYKMQKGDILVCHLTDPEWTPLFKLASAVVADTGAALSHAAIVAREFNIPAVLGVGFATTKYKDGDMIQVDGNKGVVRGL